MQHNNGPGSHSSSHQRLVGYDPQIHFQTATVQHPPRIVRSGRVGLVDVLHRVQPNQHHVQRHQRKDARVVLPGVPVVPQPQHPLNTFPFPFLQQANSFQYPPNQQLISSHQLPPLQYQNSQHQESITRLANEYRAANQYHGTTLPQVTHPQVNHFRPSGPHNAINQRGRITQHHTTRPRSQIQGQQSGMSSFTQGSFPYQPQTVENAPLRPPGLPLPSATPQVAPFPPAAHRNDINAHRQIPHGHDQNIYRPSLPSPSMYDFPTPRGRVMLGTQTDNDRTPRPGVQPSEKDDSSSESRTDTDSVIGTSSSEIGHATACTSITSGSERCVTPPDPTAKHLPLDDRMQAIVASCVDKYKKEGLDVLLNDLIHGGTQNFEQSMWNARTARLVADRLGRDGNPRTEEIEQALRFEALRIFKAYWSADGGWKTDHDNPEDKPYPMLRGVNLAGFIGSLFKASFLNADDVHMCLDLLVMNPVQLHLLCAMHALIVHCDKRLCADEHWSGTSRFCAKLTVHKRPVGGVNWESHVLINDLLGFIDRWRAIVELETIRDSVDPVKMKKKLDSRNE